MHAAELNFSFDSAPFQVESMWGRIRKDLGR